MNPTRLIREVPTPDGDSVLGWRRGEHTAAALISPHFAVSEFQCGCGRCEIQRADPRLFAMLEELRECVGRPIVISSGYRCEAHNRKVGGSTFSKHCAGLAVDLPMPSFDLIEDAAYDAALIGFQRHRALQIVASP